MMLRLSRLGFTVVAILTITHSPALAQPPPTGTDRLTPLTVSCFRCCEPGQPCRDYTAAGYHGGKANLSIAEATRDKKTIRCLSLGYDVTGASDGQFPDAQALAVALELPGNIQAMRVELLGDDSGNRAGCVLVDRTGERLFYHLAELNGSEWVTAEAKLTFPEAHWDGNNDGIPDYPLRLGSIVVTARPGARRTVGRVLVDRIEAVCDFATQGTNVLCALDDPRQPPWQIMGRGHDIAELSQADDPQEPGAKVTKLTFGLKPPPEKTEVSVGMTAKLQAPLEFPGTILLDVFGDNSKQMLVFGATDATGAAWHGWYPPLLVDWEGWRTVYLFTGGTTWRSAAEDDPDRTGRYPLKLDGIALVLPSPDVAEARLKGLILLRKLRFAPAAPEVLTTCRRELTDIRSVPMAP